MAKLEGKQLNTEDLRLALRGSLSVIGDRLDHFTRLLRATDDPEDASEYLIAGVDALRPVIDKAIELANVLKQKRRRKERSRVTRQGHESRRPRSSRTRREQAPESR